MRPQRRSTLLLSVFLLYGAACAQRPPRPLEGQVLRCCALVERPTLFPSELAPETSNLTGLAISYLEQLKQLLGFECDPLALYDAPRSDLEGFTGFANSLAECRTPDGRSRRSPECNCDIGIGCWIQNEQRVGLVDFLPAFVIDDFRMLTRNELVSSDARGGAFFITAFALKVWLAVGSIIVLFVFLKLFDRRFAPPPRPPREDEVRTVGQRVRFFALKSGLLYRMRKATQSIFAKMIQQNYEVVEGDGDSTRQWIINFILLLCGLFLVLSYEAVMTASLVQELPMSAFRSVDDLITCRVKARDVCIPRGGAVMDFWRSAIMVSSCQQDPEAGQAVFVDSFGEGIAAVSNGTCQFFMASGGVTEDTANGLYCRMLRTTGKPFLTSGGAFVLPRDSPLTDTLATATLELRRRGKLDTLEEYFERQGLCELPSDVSLTFTRLKTFFYVAWGAGIVMFLVMLLFPRGRLRRRGDEEAPEVVSRDIKDPDRFDDTADVEEIEKFDTVITPSNGTAVAEKVAKIERASATSEISDD